MRSVYRAWKRSNICDAWNTLSPDLLEGSGDTDNLCFGVLLSSSALYPLTGNDSSLSSSLINSSYNIFSASGASLCASYFSSLCTEGLVLSEREILERERGSAPLRTTDWRKSRLSNGVYCVENDGIPYSIDYFASLDQESRESED